MLRKLAPVDDKNNSSLTVVESGSINVIKKKLFNLKGGITTVLTNTENVTNFTDYSIRKETTSNFTKKSALYTKPESLSKKPTQWDLVAPNGESITIKFSAQITGTYSGNNTVKFHFNNLIK